MADMANAACVGAAGESAERSRKKRKTPAAKSSAASSSSTPAHPRAADRVPAASFSSTPAGSSSSTGFTLVPQPPLEAPPAVEAPVPPGFTLADVTETARGFLHIPKRSRPIAQLTTWGSSISARCMLHDGRCARAYPIARLPSGDTLRQWALDGLQENVTTAAQHMGLPKPIRERRA